ncbi:conserved exported hypothetical protein [Sphingobacterium sp. PM2-P1-29]|nr:conserved exported hypothetical protein [Sphingobacterium sp. PM2-P1-29]
MKKILIFILLVGCFPPIVHAQNFNEWFRQKKTQKEYLAQQIAALQVYKGALKKGYNIVEGGLNVISDLKDGELSLHKNYFEGLNRVSPYVKQYPKIELISKCYKKIYKLNRQSEDMLSGSKAFTAKELDAIHITWNKVMRNSHSLIAELEKICTDSALEMSDIQRTEHIDRIHLDMESNLSFSHSFSMEVFTVKRGRIQTGQDIRIMRSLNGLK